ncbi:MAG: response regulator transcription factor [Verrucomicrobia bacterium]|nr:response regulator transcription factor [Verrucomicrobiota bacterium]
MPRLFIVDDHQIMLDGLRLLLSQEPELEIVGVALNTSTAWEMIEMVRPDVVLMDLDVPGEGGVALTSRVVAALPATKVVVLTGQMEAPAVNAALEAGARGYVLKIDAAAELQLAIRAVLGGEIYLSPRVATLVAEEVRRRFEVADGSNALSARELEIVRRVAEGQSTKEIAFELKVSTKTVETHRTNAMEKVGEKSVAGLTKFAVREGLTKL